MQGCPSGWLGTNFDPHNSKCFSIRDKILGVTPTSPLSNINKTKPNNFKM